MKEGREVKKNEGEREEEKRWGKGTTQDFLEGPPLI